MDGSALQQLTHARQVQLLGRADRAVLQVERTTLRTWRLLLRLIRDGGPVVSTATALLRHLPLELRGVVAGELASTVRWGHRTTRAALVRAIPRRRLIELARRRHGQRGSQARGLLPSLVSHQQPGALEGDHATVRESLDFTTLFDPAGGLLSLLFPAPTPQRVDQIIYTSGWQERIRSGTGLADPLHLAQRLATGLSLGRSQEEIARDLLPAVQHVQSSARRIARTESMRVAQQIQMDQHEQLGDLVIGWQVHATLDENTRPEHRARDGTIYWLHPKPGQPGLDQRPDPPQEADGTMSWNCRCFLTPVLRDD